MTVKQYIIALFSGTLLAALAWIIVLFGINPINANSFTISSFYITLFTASAGLFTSCGTLIRINKYPNRKIDEIVKTSLRQAIILTILIVTTLILLKSNLLSWWLLLVCIAVISTIEYIFLAATHSKHQ